MFLDLDDVCGSCSMTWDNVLVIIIQRERERERERERDGETGRHEDRDRVRDRDREIYGEGLRDGGTKRHHIYIYI